MNEMMGNLLQVYLSIAFRSNRINGDKLSNRFNLEQKFRCKKI